MENITIGRFEGDETAQGVIKPESGNWQLVLDKDGFPHLYIRCKIEGGLTGLLLLEDLLPGEQTVRDLMTGEFGGECTEEEELEGMREFEASRARSGIPCPR